MGSFTWGLIVGLLGAIVAAAFVATVAYHRFIRLQDRARRAERLAELGTLTGGLAHEIKNPLSTVSLNLQLLSEDLQPDNPAYTRLHSRLITVQKETSRLREILDDFMRYAGKLEVDKKPVDVNQLLGDLVDFFLPQAQLQKVQLRLKTYDRPLIVQLDERLIKQVILNLMINAVQAMPPHGGEVILSARRDGNRALLEVTDTGRGIAPDSVARIFDAYYSTKSGGTGLGLAISKRVLIEHGGNVEVKSEVGRGTVFTLSLPV